MRKQGAGLIINVTSIAGYMGLPFRGLPTPPLRGPWAIMTAEALRMEVKRFGVDVCNLWLPGDYATGYCLHDAIHAPLIERVSPYHDLRGIGSGHH